MCLFHAETSRENIVAIRLYLSALTLVFLLVTVIDRHIGLLEAIVITSALVYLIPDTRERLQLVKADLKTLQQLEKKLSALLH